MTHTIAPPNQKLLQILLVDDNEDSLTMLRKTIHQKDRMVYSARSAKDALKILEANDIDLLLLDVQMPVMNGYEIANQVRSLPHLKHIPIIFVTAVFKARENVLKGYQLGAQDYLFKPLDADTVRAKVNALLHFALIKEGLNQEHSAHLLFRELIENSDEPVCILNSPFYRFEYVNHWFEQSFGYPSEEVKEKMFFDYFKPWERNTQIDIKPRNGDEVEKITHYKIKGLFRCADQSQQKIQWNIIEKYDKWLCIGKLIGLPYVQLSPK